MQRIFRVFWLALWGLSEGWRKAISFKRPQRRHEAGPESELHRLQFLGRRGDLRAQLELAARAAEGRGQPQDYAEAFHWCTRPPPRRTIPAPSSASASVSPTARELPQDYQEAVAWFRRAAEKDWRVSLKSVSASASRRDSARKPTPRKPPTGFAGPPRAKIPSAKSAWPSASSLGMALNKMKSRPLQLLRRASVPGRGRGRFPDRQMLSRWNRSVSLDLPEAFRRFPRRGGAGPASGAI